MAQIKWPVETLDGILKQCFWLGSWRSPQKSCLFWDLLVHFIIDLYEMFIECVRIFVDDFRYFLLYVSFSNRNCTSTHLTTFQRTLAHDVRKGLNDVQSFTNCFSLDSWAFINCFHEAFATIKRWCTICTIEAKGYNLTEEFESHCIDSVERI